MDSVGPYYLLQPGHCADNLWHYSPRKIKDPRLEAATITSVKMSRDLKFARVYFVTSGGKESIKEAIEGFIKRTDLPSEEDMKRIKQSKSKRLSKPQKQQLRSLGYLQ